MEILNESKCSISINKKRNLFKKKSNTIIGQDAFREVSLDSNRNQNFPNNNFPKEVVVSCPAKYKKENENKNEKKRLVKSDSIDNSDYMNDFHQTPVLDSVLKSRRNILKSSSKTRLGSSLDHESFPCQNINVSYKPSKYKSNDNLNLATNKNDNAEVVTADIHNHFGEYFIRKLSITI